MDARLAPHRRGVLRDLVDREGEARRANAALGEEAHPELGKLAQPERQIAGDTRKAAAGVWRVAYDQNRRLLHVRPSPSFVRWLLSCWWRCGHRLTDGLAPGRRSSRAPFAAVPSC